MGRAVAMTLLIVVAVGMPGHAGPPEGPSGRMVRDEVAEGLLRYRKTNDSEKRRALLRQLAPTGDPRVAVALGEALASTALPYPEITLLAEFYLPLEKRGSTDAVWDWWRDNEADVRRRADQLP